MTLKLCKMCLWKQSSCKWQRFLSFPLASSWRYDYDSIWAYIFVWNLGQTGQCLYERSESKPLFTKQHVWFEAGLPEIPKLNRLVAGHVKGECTYNWTGSCLPPEGLKWTMFDSLKGLNLSLNLMCNMFDLRQVYLKQRGTLNVLNVYFSYNFSLWRSLPKIEVELMNSLGVY